MKIYYGNGQPLVNCILKAASFETLAIFVENVSPSNYHLFQVADLVRSAEHINPKNRS